MTFCASIIDCLGFITFFYLEQYRFLMFLYFDEFLKIGNITEDAKWLKPSKMSRYIIYFTYKIIWWDLENKNVVAQIWDIWNRLKTYGTNLRHCKTEKSNKNESETSEKRVKKKKIPLVWLVRLGQNSRVHFLCPLIFFIFSFKTYNFVLLKF